VACVRAMHEPEGSQVRGRAGGRPQAASAGCLSQGPLLRVLAWLHGLQAVSHLQECTADVVAFIWSLSVSEEFSHQIALETVNVGAMACSSRLS
jgi:hypothetical protein